MGGRGRGGRRAQTSRRSSRGGGHQPVHTAEPPPQGDSLRFRIAATADFYEKVQPLDNRSTSVDGDTSQQAGILMQLDRWSNLTKLIKWFREGSDADATAELSFSQLLSKEHRAVIHRLTDSTGLGSLEAVSSGTGEQRCIALVRKGSKPKHLQLTDSQAFKSSWLHTWASQAGILLSRGEADEAIASDSMSPELRELWHRKSSEQRAVDRLTESVARRDAAALQEAIAAAPEVVRRGVVDVNGRAPLHLAASLGKLEAIEALLAAGAPINATDGHGVTALEVSRREEQSDAEGLLLRNGAKDPTRNVMPLVSTAAEQQQQQAAQPNGKPAADLPTVNGTGAYDAETDSEPSQVTTEQSQDEVSATSEAAAQGDASTPQQVDTAAPATPAQGKSFAAVAAGKPASDSAAAQGAEQQSSEGTGGTSDGAATASPGSSNASAIHSGGAEDTGSPRQQIGSQRSGGTTAIGASADPVPTEGEGLSETVDEGTAPAPQDQSAHTKAGLNFAKAAAAAAQLPDPAAALPNGKPAADLPSVNGKHSHDAEMKSEPSSSLIQEENKISSGLIEQDGPDHVNTTQSHAEPQKDEAAALSEAAAQGDAPEPQEAGHEAAATPTEGRSFAAVAAAAAGRPAEAPPLRDVQEGTPGVTECLQEELDAEAQQTAPPNSAADEEPKQQQLAPNTSEEGVVSSAAASPDGHAGVSEAAQDPPKASEPAAADASASRDAVPDEEGLLSEAVAQSTASEPAEEHNSQPGLNFAKAAAAQLPDPGADEQGDARPGSDHAEADVSSTSDLQIAPAPPTPEQPSEDVTKAEAAAAAQAKRQAVKKAAQREQAAADAKAQLQQEVSNLEAAQEKIAANEAESVSAVSQKIAQLQAPAEQEVTPAEPSNAEDEDNEDSKATERPAAAEPQQQSVAPADPAPANPSAGATPSDQHVTQDESLLSQNDHESAASEPEPTSTQSPADASDLSHVDKPVADPATISPDASSGGNADTGAAEADPVGQHIGVSAINVAAARTGDNPAAEPAASGKTGTSSATAADRKAVQESGTAPGAEMRSVSATSGEPRPAAAAGKDAAIEDETPDPPADAASPDENEDTALAKAAESGQAPGPTDASKPPVTHHGLSFAQAAAAKPTAASEPDAVQARLDAIPNQPSEVDKSEEDQVREAAVKTAATEAQSQQNKADAKEDAQARRLAAKEGSARKQAGTNAKDAIAEQLAAVEAARQQAAESEKDAVANRAEQLADQRQPADSVEEEPGSDLQESVKPVKSDVKEPAPPAAEAASAGADSTSAPAAEHQQQQESQTDVDPVKDDKRDQPTALGNAKSAASEINDTTIPLTAPEEDNSPVDEEQAISQAATAGTAPQPADSPKDTSQASGVSYAAAAANVPSAEEAPEASAAPSVDQSAVPEGKQEAVKPESGSNNEADKQPAAEEDEQAPEAAAAATAAALEDAVKAAPAAAQIPDASTVDEDAADQSAASDDVSAAQQNPDAATGLEIAHQLSADLPDASRHVEDVSQQAQAASPAAGSPQQGDDTSGNAAGQLLDKPSDGLRPVGTMNTDQPDESAAADQHDGASVSKQPVESVRNKQPDDSAAGEQAPHAAVSKQQDGSAPSEQSAESGGVQPTELVAGKQAADTASGNKPDESAPFKLPSKPDESAAGEQPTRSGDKSASDEQKQLDTPVDSSQPGESVAHESSTAPDASPEQTADNPARDAPAKQSSDAGTDKRATDAAAADERPAPTSAGSSNSTSKTVRRSRTKPALPASTEIEPAPIDGKAGQPTWARRSRADQQYDEDLSASDDEDGGGGRSGWLSAISRRPDVLYGGLAAITSIVAFLAVAASSRPQPCRR